MTIDIHHIVKLMFAKLIKDIGLSYLSCPKQYKRFALWIAFPLQQIVVYQSFHAITIILINLQRYTFMRE